MRIKLAVLDRDRGYLDRLSAFFAARYADKLEVYTFTDAETAQGCLRQSGINVFLAGEAFEIRADALPKRCGLLRLSEAPETGTVGGVRAVCKFRRAESLYKAILETFDSAAALGENVPARAASQGGAGLIWFTSVGGGSGCSSAAAACALRLARAGRGAFYIDFDPFGDSRAFFAGEGDSNLGDVIYALKSGKSNLALKLEICARRDASGVSFFAPPATALDMLEMDCEDADRLTAALADSGLYDAVIVDRAFTAGPDSVKLLRRASAAVFVSDGSESSLSKLRRASAVIDIFEEQGEIEIPPPVFVFHNMCACEPQTPDGALRLGCAPRFAGAAGGAPRFGGVSESRRVAERLSQLEAFDALPRRICERPAGAAL